MSHRTTLHISTAIAFMEGYRARGLSTAQLLLKVGEDPELLEREDGRFPISKLGNLIAQISHDLRDETLGFLQRPTPPGGLEMWIHSSITSRTLGEAFKRWIRFWRLVHEDQRTTLSVVGDEVRVATSFLRDDDVDRSSFATWEMFLMLRLASWMIGKPLLLDRLYFTFHKPADPDDYYDMFPARHYFDHHENCIVFNRRYLDMPIVQPPEHVPDFVANLPHLMSVQRVDQSLTAQIRRMVQAVDEGEDITLGDIAARLNRSEDTVRRHLKAEGSAFSEIKESVRRDMAVYHLECLNTPVSQIAYMLGFSEPSAFNRAFKRWTGQAPGDYRASLQSAPNPAVDDNDTTT